MRQMPQPRPRSSFTRWFNPDAESSWAVLWAHAVGWAVLLVVWVGYLILADVEGYRLFLYPLLSLVAVFEILVVAGCMVRKRGGPSGR